MIADEIRKHGMSLFDQLKEKWESNPSVEQVYRNAIVSMEMHKYQMLCEIAAQLADLNEHFRAVDTQVFGTEDAKAKAAKKQ